jgi:predicted nucleotidyltransferase component of viral defense system
MAQTFGSPAAFKASLEDRLKRIAAERGLPINALRLKLVIERLLARLFHESEPPWLLKGGYAMELRYRPRARTTRDIDLTVNRFAEDESLSARLDKIREELQTAADIDLGDYLAFQILTAQTELQGAPMGGARFTCVVLLAGRAYGRFHIDLGFGDASTGAADPLTGDDLLAFAGFAPAHVLAVPCYQQFAEKLHAYTLPRQERINTRAKDLVDLVLLIETEKIDLGTLRRAVEATFSRRGTHPIPEDLPLPPTSWTKDFARMADEAQLGARSLDDGFAVLRRFWSPG